MLTRREYQRWKRTRTKATSLGPAFWNEFLEPEEIENHALCMSDDAEAENIIITQYVRGYRKRPSEVGEDRTVRGEQ